MLQTIVDILNDAIGSDLKKPDAAFKFGLDAVHIISDVETLRVVADRTRLRMLESLSTAPRTVKQIASELDVSPTKLYYHVRLLEEHGLIRVVDSRVVSGIVEKSYQTSAYRFSVDHALLPGVHDDSSALDVMLSVILDEAAGEIRRGVERGLIDLTVIGVAEGGMVLGRSWLRMTPAQAELYVERMTDAYFEIARLATESESAQTRMYEVLTGIYPTMRGPDDIEQHGDVPIASLAVLNDGGDE